MMKQHIAPATKGMRHRWENAARSRIEDYWNLRHHSDVYRQTLRDQISQAKYLRDHEFPMERIINRTCRFLMLK